MCSPGVDLGDLAVLVPSNRLVQVYERSIADLGLRTQELQRYDGRPTSAVKVGTYQRAKGLEFKQVFLPRLDPEALGEQQRHNEDDETYRERLDLLRRQLFVALTRARDDARLGAVGAVARLISPLLDSEPRESPVMLEDLTESSFLRAAQALCGPCRSFRDMPAGRQRRSGVERWTGRRMDGSRSGGSPPWFAADNDHDGTGVVPVRAPVAWLYAALAVAAAGLATVPMRPVPVHLAGYALSAFGCMGLLATFSHLDSRARATRLYLVTPWVSTVSRITAVAAVLAAAGHVWYLATWLAS